MRIYHARVLTMTGETLENGYVEIENERIRAVGEGEPSAIGAEDIDAQGGWLLPGLIDAHTHLGMWEDGLAFEGDDGNEDTDPLMPQLRAIDAVNPLEHCFEEALAAGITTVITGPGSANPIGGQMAAIKTYGHCIDRMIVKAPVAMKMALGENPKGAYHAKSQTPVTRMATAALIREQLAKAKKYAEQCAEAAQDDEVDEPEYDAKCEALRPVISGELPVHFHAHRADDMLTARRIAQEFGLNYVIVHGTEAALCMDVLAQEQIPVLSGPILCERCKPELKNLSADTPAKLASAGVPFALVTDHPVIPLNYLNLCAGLAVREGLAPEQALRAVTLYPAQIVGIADRVGSIEAGKDADLVLFPDDPLTLSAKPIAVIAGGLRVL